MTITNDRRAFLRSVGQGALGLGAVAGLAACGVPTPGPGSSAIEPGDSRLRVGYLPITDATPLLVAHGLGLYADEGLEPERPVLLRSWAQVAEAFQARQVDIVHLLMPMTVQIRFGQQLPIKVVAWNHTGGSALTVGKGINDVEQLAGTTIAVPFWYSIHNVALQMLLGRAGLTPVIDGEPSVQGRTVKLVVMAPPDMPPALAAGGISAFIVADPFNSVAELNDIGSVLRFTGDLWRDHACCVAVMHEDAITERPEWSQAVVNALARAQIEAHADRTGIARLLSNEGESYLPQPLPVIERSLTHYDQSEYGPTGAITHPDWETERIGFQPFPYASYTEQLVTSLQQTVVDGDRQFLDSLDPASAHGELVNDVLIRSAIEKAGGPVAFGMDGYDRTEVIDV